MADSFSIAEARNNLAALVHTLRGHAAIRITRRGKPVAVLVAIEEYERLSAGKRRFWDAYSEFREGADLAALDIGPDDFAGLRDPSAGRAVDL